MQETVGKSLTSYEVVVNLIANTTTKTDLSIQTTLDTRDYPVGIKITDEQIKGLNLRGHDFHSD